MEVTNLLLTLIAGLLTVIGFFIVQFYGQVQRLIRDFHIAMQKQAEHHVRIENLEHHINHR
jgi:hypothetical protein